MRSYKIVIVIYNYGIHIYFFQFWGPRLVPAWSHGNLTPDCLVAGILDGLELGRRDRQCR